MNEIPNFFKKPQNLNKSEKSSESVPGSGSIDTATERYIKKFNENN